MDKSVSALDFRLMSLWFKFRDSLFPRKHILQEVDIKPGDKVLDYGCGPGSYTIVVAQSVGESGRVYALDINPLAVQSVQNIVAKRKLTNVETIHSDCATGLPDESMDVVLLYDILHDLTEPEAVLAELHRVLKKEGILSCNDHHLKEEIPDRITGKGLFKMVKRGEKVYNFTKTS
ncbi:class I SAM-dependent methyltransferase [Chloroflexota bacterium]